MTRWGEKYRCSYCHIEGVAGEDLDEQYDRYHIYAGLWHEKCWKQHGYGDFQFDPAYAGERLEEDY
jgi:hypothetical protein